VNEP